VKKVLVIIPISCDSIRGASCLNELHGVEVLRHSLNAADEARPELVVVSTPDAALAETVRNWGFLAVERPEQLAGPDIRAEQVVLHCLDYLEDGPLADKQLPEYVVLLAADLPLRRPGRVAAACARVICEEADSLFSCSRETPLYWRQSQMGMIPYYDPDNRPARSAELDRTGNQVWHRENGSVYVFSSQGLRKHNNRLFGKVACLEMDREEVISTDKSAGLAMCRAIARVPTSTE